VHELDLQTVLGRSPTILFLGAHCDDIEIGCGGTALRIVDRFPDADVHWVVFTSSTQRSLEAEAAANVILRGVRRSSVDVKKFRDGFLPYVGFEVKESFEELKARVSPDLIFTHYGRDAHQDHRLVSELTWNTFRDHLILEYEVPKYDGDLGSPNVYVPLHEDVVAEKIKIVMGAYPSQAGRGWFSDDTFRAILRLRGVESNAPGGYAEGFYSRKLVIEL
jgi:LmbE family N-acetylglucosaminyl deacetylase